MSFLISMLHWGAVMSHLDSEALIKVFSSTDGCYISVSVGGQGLRPPIPSADILLMSLLLVIVFKPLFGVVFHAAIYN